MDLDNLPEVPAANSKADEAALELMKQLITLASGVLALSAAFIDKLPKTPKPFLSILILSWLSLIAALFFGLRTISTIVKSRISNDHEWWRGKGRSYGRTCRYSFLAGIGLFAAFAFISLALPASKENEITLTIRTDDPNVIDSIKQIIPQAAPTPVSSPAATIAKPTQ